MSTELDELYQSLILDHNRSPRNFHKLENPSAHAEGRNPLCGDMYDIWLKLEGDRITEAAFLGQGCAISKASASMMTQAIQGKTVAEARSLFEAFHDLVAGSGEPETPGRKPEAGIRESRGEEAGALPARLRVFRGVRAFPIRVKCATLSWHAMKHALEAVRGER